MAERGKHKYAYISATSNTVVKAAAGTLYGITGTAPAGTLVRIDDTHRFGQGVLDINAVSSNTVGAFAVPSYFDGLAVDTGIAVAVSSNAKVTIEYE